MIGDKIPLANTFFFSRDLKGALDASDAVLMKEMGIAAPSKPAVIVDEAGNPLYRCNNLCTEFVTSDVSASKFEDALKLIASTRPMLHARRFIRLLLLDRLSPSHAKVICHTMDRQGEFNVYFLISSSAGNIELNMRSRFMLLNCNSEVTRAMPFTHAACDALVSELLAQAGRIVRSRPDAVFDLAHKAAYKLCGTMIPIEHVCRSCATVMGPACRDDAGRANVVRICADVDAIKRAVNKPSLLFDYVLYACLCEVLKTGTAAAGPDFFSTTKKT